MNYEHITTIRQLPLFNYNQKPLPISVSHWEKARSASRRLQNSVKSNRNDPQCRRVAPPASFTLRKRRQHSIIAGALENRFRSLLGKHTTEMILWSMISTFSSEWLSCPFIGNGKSDKTFSWQANISFASLFLPSFSHRHKIKIELTKRERCKNCASLACK